MTLALGLRDRSANTAGQLSIMIMADRARMNALAAIGRAGLCYGAVDLVAAFWPKSLDAVGGPGGLG